MYGDAEKRKVYRIRGKAFLIYGGCDADGMNRISWIVIIGLSGSSICLSVCHSLLVVSWSVNVHLLDEHVYVVLFLSKDRVSRVRDFHHGLFALRGSSIKLSV